MFRARHGRHRPRLRRSRRAGAPDRRRRGVVARARADLPRPDRAARPAAERLPHRASPSARWPRPTRPTRAAAPATSARCSACRSRSRTTSTSPARSTAWGTSAHGGPAPQDAEVVRRLRAAGAIVLGKTNVPEMTIWPFTETITFGATRNPWDVERTPGGSSGGTGAAVAAGMVGLGLGSDGAGLDPHPGRLVRPVRPQAAARPRPARAARRRLAGAVGQRPAHAHASPTPRCSSTRRPTPAASPRAAAREPGKLRIAVSTKLAAGQLARIAPDVRAAVERTRGAAALARPRGGRARPRPARARCAAPARALLARHPRRRRAGDAAPAAARAPHARRWRGSARLIPASVVAKQRAAEAGDRRADQHSSSTTPTSCCTPGRGDAAVADRPVPRPRRAVDAQRRRAARARSTGCWNATGQPAASVPPGSTATACRSACSSSAARTTRRRCSRSRAQLEAARPVGRPPPAGQLSASSRPRSPRRPRAPPARCCSSASASERALDSHEVHADRPRQRGRPARGAGDPRRPRASARPTTRSWGRRATTRPARSGRRWIVDPLDGTINFLFGIPQWCVSASPARASPASSSTRCATSCSRRPRTGGATLNGAPLRGVAPRRPGDGARGDRLRLRRRACARAPGARSWRACCRACATSAAPGSAALDLAWAAAGRLDAFYERGVKPWDIAAGVAAVHGGRPGGAHAAGDGRAAAPACWSRRAPLVEPLLALVA